MNIPFSAKLVDLANLVVAKGANFLLTLLIFGLVSGGLDAGQFANFGYWWSIAIMVGGVLLGGLSSGLIRVVSVRGSLAHLRAAATRSAAAFAVALAGIAVLAMLWPSQRGWFILCAGAAVFGIVSQLQASMLGLLRAATATRANAIASVIVVVLVPAVMWVLLGNRRDLQWIFMCLVAAFIAGTIAVSVATRQVLGSLLGPRADLPKPDPLFLSSVASFTAINVFSYSSLNIDFTLFKWMRHPADFAVMATCKIFFDRFLLPGLLVIAGAFSLSVLRYNNTASLPSGHAPRFELRFRPRYFAAVGAIGVGAVLGYLWFVTYVRGDARALPIALVACVAAGYLIYAFNAVLLDVLVVRRGLGAVIGHVTGFLLLCLVLQAAAIRFFGLAGWATCWFLFNLVVHAVLVRECVDPSSRAVVSDSLVGNSPVQGKILWFVSSLEKKGGGERFVLEGVNAIRAQGYDAVIVCDRLNGEADFDGTYDLKGVLCTSQDYDPKAGYLSLSLSKLGGLLALYRVVRSERPDFIICQSEFDAIKLYVLSGLLRFKYRTFVFGQMFQIRDDISKYSSVFRRHLETIAASRPGYRETVTLPPPRLSKPVWLLNEMISRLKYRALRSADRVFVLSNQVKWEVSLLYGCDAHVCRAAFDENYIDIRTVSAPRPVAESVRLLSVCRLADKKRVDLIIRAFSKATSPAVLTIIGCGPEEARLRELAAASARAASIRFLGAVSDEALQAELAVADCFVSMDIGDYDISVVEAMGKGLRVLVASDFDLSEFGPDFTGVQSIEPEVSALSRAMDSLATMSPPSAANLPALRRLTWQHLAGMCVAP